MKIYLAARYGRQAEIRRYRDELIAAGHLVTARWLDEGPEDAEAGKESAPKWAEYGEMALFDLLDSDCSIHFTEGPAGVPGKTRGGKHTEFGIALMLCNHANTAMQFRRGDDWLPPLPHRIIVVGHRENVFHWLPEVEFYPAWEQARAALGYGDEEF